jgi:hypothetical protein
MGKWPNSPGKSTAMGISMIDNKDILAYLNVLGYAPVWDRLTVEEQQLGKQNICGCYSRLMEALEKDTLHGDSRVLYMQIQRREHLNVHLNLPRGDPSLEASTEQTAKMLFEYLRGDFVSPAIQSQFLNTLDAQLSKILESKNATPAH